MKRIVAAVPGRLRIKDSQFVSIATVERVIAALREHLPLTHTRPNPGAGSIVLHYALDRITPEEMQRRTEAVLGRLLGRGSRARGRSMRLHLNRASKMVAVGSLVTSLAFGVARYKQLHIVTGWIFVASVVVHMAVFRRTLLN